MEDSFLSPRDFPSHPAYIYPSYGSSVKRGPTRPLIPLKESCATSACRSTAPKTSAARQRPHAQRGP